MWGRRGLFVVGSTLDGAWCYGQCCNEVWPSVALCGCVSDVREGTLLNSINREQMAQIGKLCQIIDLPFIYKIYFSECVMFLFVFKIIDGINLYVRTTTNHVGVYNNIFCILYKLHSPILVSLFLYVVLLVISYESNTSVWVHIYSQQENDPGLLTN